MFVPLRKLTYRSARPVTVTASLFYISDVHTSQETPMGLQGLVGDGFTFYM
jgi:hypothetical protein